MALKIVGLEKMSLVDYDDKLCITLFLNGCNMRCPFCHNGPLVFSTTDEEHSLEEIENLLKERIGKIDAVTITGGEPTLHKDLLNLILMIKKYPYLIKLDTNGTNPDLIRYLHEHKLVDYFAIDVKNSLSKYEETIGIKNFPFLSQVQASIQYLIASDADYEFRTTLVKEFHEIEDIKQIAKEIKGAKRWRLQKFIPAETCIQQGLHEVEREEADKMLQEARKIIDDVELRSY